MAFKSKILAKRRKTWVNVVNFRFIKISNWVLDQNVTKQTYPKISCRSQKCLVQLLNQEFDLVN